jgi:Asp/Glu/hydantoin racemase/DUF917 family protein
MVADPFLDHVVSCLQEKTQGAVTDDTPTGVLLVDSSVPGAITGHAAVVSAIGSPQKILDGRIPFTRSPVLVVERLQAALPRDQIITHVLPFECGTCGLLTPVVTAFERCRDLRGRPEIRVLDADGVGRAVPQMVMSTYATSKVPIAPFAFANEPSPGGLVVDGVFDAKDNGATTELVGLPGVTAINDMIREVIGAPEYGKLGCIAAWVMGPSDAGSVPIAGTVTEALELGAVLRQAQKQAAQTPGKDHSKATTEAVLQHFQSVGRYVRLLGAGRVLDTASTTDAAGFDFDLARLDLGGGDELLVLAQNENLVAWDPARGDIVAMGPDLIAYVSPDGQPLSNTDLPQYKAKHPEGKVLVFAIQAHERARGTEVVSAMLDSIGNLLGTTGKVVAAYVPLEKLADGASTPWAKRLPCRDGRVYLKVIVPVATADYNAEIQATIEAVLPADAVVDLENIPVDTPEATTCIEGRTAISLNTPHVLKIATKAQALGYNGIFVTDMDFCGVESMREIVDIPVIGGFQPSAFTALSLADRFSIITILDSVVAMQRQHTREFCITEGLASVKVVSIPVPDLTNKDKVLQAVYGAAIEAITADGAGAIILGCTGFVDIAREVSRMLTDAGHAAPVLDPNQTAILFLYMLVRCGLTQSRQVYMSQPDLPL